jgi:hypothetical protein
MILPALTALVTVPEPIYDLGQFLLGLICFLGQMGR